MKNALLIFAFLSFYLSSVHASVEIRSNKLTTGDGLANNKSKHFLKQEKGMTIVDLYEDNYGDIYLATIAIDKIIFFIVPF